MWFRAFLMTCITLAPASTLAAEPITLFGIPFNEPLSVPECPWNNVRDYGSQDRSATRRRYINTRFSDEVCYTQYSSIGEAPKDDLVGFVFPLKDAPSLGQVSGRLVGGRLARMEVSTRGIRTQENDLVALTQKFGQPVTATQPAVQNRMGASFQTIRATWKLPNEVTVMFSSVVSQVDEGVIIVTTPAGAEAEEQANQEFQRRYGGREL